jgi:TP901 family phage tail tape measure protein
VALSTREVLLVLRARDEATRTIARVGHAMNGLDREAATSASRMIDDQRAVVRGLSTQLGEVNSQYSQTVANAYAMHRRQQDATNASLAQIRNSVRGVNDEYTKLARAQQDMYHKGRMDAESYRKNMTQIRRLRDDQLNSLTRERDAIYDTSRANQQAYHDRIISARQLHNAQKENIRLERLNAQEIIRTNQQILDDEEHIRRVRTDQGHKLMSIGSSATYAGVSMAAMGAVGVYAWAQTNKAAIEYEQTARRTLTQVDNNAIKLNQVSKAGKRIADTVPIAFEQIQPAMYDVFSSIDVGLRGATKLTKQFAKDAVGGATDMATATRANLAIMNAYGIKVKDVGEVSDFMFQLVRKGVGSYDEFAKVIGRSIPSAARAGQTYHTLGAMLAFMTRNGMSAAMASTSAARALDAISHPKTVAKLQDMGIKVKNLRGEFLPLPDILDQLREKFEGLSRPELANKLYELFKSSGGTIQARRFFDMYFRNADEFNQRTKEMGETAGEAKKAFDKMADSPAGKLQALKNDWMLLRVELGENLMPIAMRVVETLNDWIDAFQRLSPAQRETITKTLAIGTAVFGLIGILVAVGGAITVFLGALKLLNVGMGVAAGKMGFFGIALAGLATGFTQVVTGSTEAEKALGVFIMAASGAIGGFAIAGPIGALVGGLVGALGGLATAAAASADEAKYANANWKDLKDTLDQVTGATTRATASFVYDEAQRSGLFDALKNENITRRQVVEGIMHEGQERNRLTGIVVAAQNRLNEIMRQGKALEAEAKQGVSSARMQEIIKEIQALDVQRKTEEALIKAIQGGIGTVEKSADAIRRKSAATLDFSEIAKKVPKQVITQFKAGNLPATIEDVARLSMKFKGLDKKQITAIMKFLGIEGSMKDVDNMKRKIGELSKAKPDLSGFITGVQRGARNAAEAAQKGGSDVAKNLKTTTGKAKADLSAFQTSVKNGVQAAVGPANSGGIAVGGALKAGVISGFAGTQAQLAADAAAAVRGAIAAARAAAKAHSPSQEMWDVGKDLADGLRLGWDQNINKMKVSPAVMKAVKELLGDMASTIPQMSTLMDMAREILEKKMDKQREALVKKIEKQKNAIRKANEATKGTKGDKLLSDVGQHALEQFDKQVPKKIKEKLEAIRKEVEKEFKKLQKAVQRYQDALKAIEAAHTEFSNLESGLDFKLLPDAPGPQGPAWDRLRAVVAAYKSTVAQLQTEQQKLDELQSQRNSYIQGLKASMENLRNMGDIRGDEIMENVLERGRVVQRGTGQYKDVTISDIVTGMQSKLAKIKEYGDMLTRLRNMGYSNSVIDTILQMGPEAGLAYAKALASATPEQMAQVNAADAGITSLASHLATEAGSMMFDAGIAIQQGIVDGLQNNAAILMTTAQALAQQIEAGLQAELAAANAAAQSLAIQVVNGMNEVLGTGEANKGREQGRNVGAGIRRGLDDMANEVAWGARHLAWTIVHNFNEVLKLRSPSKVAIEKGRFFGKGVAIGLHREMKNVSIASRKLAKQVEFDAQAEIGSPKLRTQPYGAKMGAGNTYQQEINVSVQELDPQRHAAMLGWELANRGL